MQEVLGIECRRGDMQAVLVDACKRGDINRVRELLGLEGFYDIHAALYIAVCFNQITVAQFLLKTPESDPNVYHGFIVSEAIRNNFTEIALLLITDPRFDPATDKQGAIFWAADYNRAELTRVLLSNPRVDATGAIQGATGECRVILATHVKWGIHKHRDLYERYHPELVEAYDAVTVMTWVGKQQRTWDDLVEPVAKRLKVSF